LRDQHRQIGGKHLYLAAEQVGQRRRRAAIGHVQEFYVRRDVEQFLGEMRR